VSSAIQLFYPRENFCNALIRKVLIFLILFFIASIFIMKNFSAVNLRQFLFALFILIGTKANSQTLFYSDVIHGGITCGGYAPDYSSGGTGTINISIAAASTIHQAYLMAGRHGNASDITVTLNGNSVTFYAANQVSLTFQSPLYGGNSGVHAVDVTNIVDPSVNTYTLNVPNQTGPSDRYNDFYLFVEYENSSLPTINTAIFLNEYDLADTVTWTLGLPFAWNTAYDAALSLFTGYSCFNGDDDAITIDGTYLGNYYGPESNSGSCGGPMGNFYYDNGILTGLGDDNADQSMTGPDVISNVSGVVTNGNMSSSIFFDSNTGSPDNAIWAVVVANGGGCPLASAGPDTTVCFGNGVQLSASGGTNFSWSPVAGLSNPNIANPVATPDSTTMYVVIASDSNGCSSTDSVLIAVYPPGIAGPDVTICKSDSTQLSATGGVSYSWQPATFLSDANIADPICTAQTTTTYTVTITDANGCITMDELIVNVVPTVIAPTITQNGNVLTCSTEVSYQWKLNTVDIPGATNQTYTITIGGFYSCAVITETGCPTESAPFYAAPVGINELTSPPAWEIFPNPATDELFISTSEINCMIGMLNVLGQEVISPRPLHEGVMTINVKNLAAGIYYVELKNENGTFVKKWVKK